MRPCGTWREIPTHTTGAGAVQGDRPSCKQARGRYLARAPPNALQEPSHRCRGKSMTSKPGEQKENHTRRLESKSDKNWRDFETKHRVRFGRKPGVPGHRPCVLRAVLHPTQGACTSPPLGHTALPPPHSAPRARTPYATRWGGAWEARRVSTPLGGFCDLRVAGSSSASGSARPAESAGRFSLAPDPPCSLSK